MKVVCLLGSPREKGNSARIAKRFCDTTEKNGAEVQTFLLNKMKYWGCQACMSCKGKLEKCAVEDDLTAVLEAVTHCDILVMATPVYLGSESSQLKVFIDRSFSFLTPDFHYNPDSKRLAPGKKMVFIQTQGQHLEELFDDIYPRVKFIFSLMGFKESYLIRACGVDAKDDVEKKEDVLKQAEETAEKISREI